MTTRPRPFTAVAALFVAAALLVTACGDSGSDSGTDKDSKTTVTSATAASIADVTGSIKGSGASFPDAFYQEAVAGLADVAPDLTVTYDAIGSSSGREAFAQDLNDFAGTDSLVGDDEAIEKGTFSYIPTTAASIAIVYNLPGVDDLKLDGPTLAKIF
ncbi:MAG: substrate-binding domain-containing protein, partial [Acidimicrobiales bacterium]|nr:substrate-binding domain-containing protein [Acidimicrobiales bacterium]